MQYHVARSYYSVVDEQVHRMKVLYDSSCFFQSYGGVSRYYCEMIKRLPNDIDVILPMKETVNKYLQEQPFNIPEMRASVHDFVRKYFHGWYMPGVSYLYKFVSRCFPRVFPAGENLNSQILKEHIVDLDFDIYHVTGPNYYNKSWRKVRGKKPIVVTVHDIIFDKIIKDQRVIKGRRELLNVADAVIAVSEYTKNELMTFYDVAASKIKVIHHGTSLQASMPKEDKGYILYVGQRGGYKNWDWFIKAISPLIKNDGFSLICTGSDFTQKEKRILSQLGIMDRVSARFVPDDEMKELFSHTSTFVYPSECEGFGLPILDAWACGCPVVLPRWSCFPEVARNGAAYYNLNDAEGMRQSIRLASKEGRMSLIENGYSELLRFSWDKCAADTFSVYKSVV